MIENGSQAQDDGDILAGIDEYNATRERIAGIGSTHPYMQDSETLSVGSVSQASDLLFQYSQTTKSQFYSNSH